MCPTNPQKDLKSRKGNEPFWGIASEMEFLGSIGARNGSSELTPHALRLRVYAMFTRRSLGVGRRYLSSVVPQGGT